ncbi:ribosome silencing factor [bacterium]|nr:ribosome silencing factor [bacterium]MBU1073103.1 ribosome silencing factor [bacterium]MBU1674646.1 ribosome silencing factor [bacterium]
MSKQTEPWYVREAGASFRLAELAAHAIVAKKGEDVLVLDLRGRSDVADFFVLGTGLSNIQVESIGRSVSEELAGAGHEPLHTEGFESSNWILLDYVDVIVHVMKSRIRDYYRLERLWSDAGRCEVGLDYFRRPEVAGRHPDLPLVRRDAAAAGEHEAEEGP